jgi:hypothetical protein
VIDTERGNNRCFSLLRFSGYLFGIGSPQSFTLIYHYHNIIVLLCLRLQGFLGVWVWFVCVCSVVGRLVFGLGLLRLALVGNLGRVEAMGSLLCSSLYGFDTS